MPPTVHVRGTSGRATAHDHSVKAAVLVAVGAPPRFGDFAEPEPSVGQMVIEVAATGTSRSGILRGPRSAYRLRGCDPPRSRYWNLASAADSGTSPVKPYQCAGIYSVPHPDCKRCLIRSSTNTGPYVWLR